MSLQTMKIDLVEIYTTRPMLERYTANFDNEVKPLAVEQIMRTDHITFDEATNLLGYQQGVDFVLDKVDIIQPDAA